MGVDEYGKEVSVDWKGDEGGDGKGEEEDSDHVPPASIDSKRHKGGKETGNDGEGSLKGQQ